MATALVPTEEAAPDVGGITIHEILQADNLIDLISEADLGRIGSRCLQEFEYDLQSRKSSDEETQDWEKRKVRELVNEKLRH